MKTFLRALLEFLLSYLNNQDIDMADAKISALTSLAGTDVDAAADVLPIVDTGVTTTKKITPSALGVSINTALTTVTNSLAADVDLNNTSAYFDGPSCAQGTSGTWLATGHVVLTDTAANGAFYVKLWDGATVIASTYVMIWATNVHISVPISGILASPAGNIRISVKDIVSGFGKIVYNGSGNSKDSTLTVRRII